MLPYWLTGLFYAALRPFVESYFNKHLHILVVNAHLVPKDGPVILAANHLRVIDSPLIGLTSGVPPRRVTFLAKREYSQIKNLKSFVTAAGIFILGQIPIDRNSRKKSADSLEVAKAHLSKNRVIGIHVEGTRSTDGRLYNSRLGFAHIALNTQATIVPVALEYFDKSYFGFEAARVTYGSPVKYEDYSAMNIREIGEYFTERIRILGNQERANKVAPISNKNATR